MKNYFNIKIQKILADKSFFEILIGSIWALGAQILATCLAMITSIVIARMYGAEIMGTVALINSYLMLASIVTVLGTNTSIMRLIPEHVVKFSMTSAFKIYRKTQFFVASVSVIVGFFLFFGSDLIAGEIFSKPHLYPLFALASVFLVFKSLLDFNTQSIRGLRLVRVFALMRVLPSLANLLFLFGSTYVFFNQYNPVYAVFSSFLIASVTGMFFMEKEFKKNIKYSEKIKETSLKNILSISFPMLMTGMLTFVIGQTGVVLLGIFRGESEVGYYDTVVKLASLTAFVLQAINAMIAPKFSELYHSGKIKKLLRLARKSTKLIFWTSTPILLVLTFFGKFILKTLFGEPFVVGYSAMLFLVIGQFVNAISGSTGIFMNMTGNEKKFRNIIAISSVINVVLSVVLIPRFGMYGAAFAAMISMIFWNICTLLFIRTKFGCFVGYFPLVT